MTRHKLANRIMVKCEPFQKMVTIGHPWREGHSIHISACWVFFKIWDHYSLHYLLSVELVLLILDTIIMQYAC